MEDVRTFPVYKMSDKLTHELVDEVFALSRQHQLVFVGEIGESVSTLMTHFRLAYHTDEHDKQLEYLDNCIGKVVRLKTTVTMWRETGMIDKNKADDYVSRLKEIDKLLRSYFNLMEMGINMQKLNLQ